MLQKSSCLKSMLFAVPYEFSAGVLWFGPHLFPKDGRNQNLHVWEPQGFVISTQKEALTESGPTYREWVPKNIFDGVRLQSRSTQRPTFWLLPWDFCPLDYSPLRTVIFGEALSCSCAFQLKNRINPGFINYQFMNMRCVITNLTYPLLNQLQV